MLHVNFDTNLWPVVCVSITIYLCLSYFFILKLKNVNVMKFINLSDEWIRCLLFLSCLRDI